MSEGLKKWIIQLAAALFLAFVLMWVCGLGSAENTADKIRAVCDGFTVSAFLHIGMGVLFWASSTGFFDIFSYALRKGAHAIIPGFFKDTVGGYYEYKIDKGNGRKQHSHWRTLVVGLCLLVVGFILTALWYQVAGE